MSTRTTLDAATADINERYASTPLLRDDIVAGLNRIASPTVRESDVRERTLAIRQANPGMSLGAARLNAIQDVAYARQEPAYYTQDDFARLDPADMTAVMNAAEQGQAIVEPPAPEWGSSEYFEANPEEYAQILADNGLTPEYVAMPPEERAAHARQQLDRQEALQRASVRRAAQVQALIEDGVPAANADRLVASVEDIALAENFA